MMYICVGKGCSGRSNRSPEYSDIQPVSPSKVKLKTTTTTTTTTTATMNNTTAYTAQNCNGIERSIDEIDSKPRGGNFLRMNSLNLDMNSNSLALESEPETKSNTLPRRSQPKQNDAPPKPPRLIPPKPPRMMEKKIFVCENPCCRKEEELLGIVELTFKSCSACFTHYCSPECKTQHWPEHRTVCRYGTIDCHMKSILRLCKHTVPIHLYLSEIARKGFMSQGRGAVMIILLSPKEAELFIKTGLDYFKRRRDEPTYSSIKQIESAGAYTKYQKTLLKAVRDYSTVHEFVVNIAIVVGKSLDTTPVPRNKAPAVIEHITIPLHSNLNARTLSPQGSQDYTNCSSPYKQDLKEFLETSTRRKSH